MLESTVSVWLIVINPTIPIIAITAATPARIPNVLLDEKVDEELLFEFEIVVVTFGCDCILVLGCL
jgi:hypothetical protein